MHGTALTLIWSFCAKVGRKFHLISAKDQLIWNLWGTMCICAEGARKFDMLWTKNQYDAWKDCLFAQDNFPLMQPKSEAYMENWGRFAPKAQENLSFCQLKSNMKLTLRLSFCADAGENLTWFQLKIDMN